MLILSLLLVPACLGAPPGNLHNHIHAETDCTKNYCRVSNDTLDSALETFLCMNKDDIRDLQTEKEKKLLLAQKIAPLLTMEDGSSVEDELSKMDTARLVPLVNLVLHSGDAAVEPKTELEYSRALREELAAATSLHPSLYRRANPIVLGILNCQAKLLSGLDTILHGSRNGKMLPNLFGSISQKMLALLGGFSKFSQTTMAATTTVTKAATTTATSAATTAATSAATTIAACSRASEPHFDCNCENSGTGEAVPCTTGQFCRDGKCLNVCDIGMEPLVADCFCTSGAGSLCPATHSCRAEGCQSNEAFFG